MIPTIEEIVDGLADGTIPKSQAVTWLHAHAEGAANNLRNYFAAKAMQGAIASGDHNAPLSIALLSYRQADTMLRVSNEPRGAL
jgi:hypothetical protein